jgi:putative membrane protein
MNEPMTNPYPSNAQAELARERNRIAADRSLLSFIRNSVTLIGAGIGINQIVRTLAPSAPFMQLWVDGLTLALIGLGVINLSFAIVDYQGEMKRLRQPEYYFTPRWSLGGVTGWVLFMVGLIVFFRLVTSPLI